MPQPSIAHSPGISAEELLPFSSGQRLRLERTLPDALLARLADAEPQWRAALDAVSQQVAEVELPGGDALRLRLPGALRYPLVDGAPVELRDLTLAIERRGAWMFDALLSATVAGAPRVLQRREGLYAARRGNQVILARHDGRRLVPRLGITHLAQAVTEIELFTTSFRDRAPEWARAFLPARLSLLKLIPLDPATGARLDEIRFDPTCCG